mmetsp:Transcript_39207/g.59815  ORF Transcript_39207/g.59815 Transcript_39207/m.59815 type:complete len:212 (-) Transcript_39207:1509-2144(-)
MQDKLEKFRQFNNPKRIADLRKFCATSITTQTSQANTGRISSRLQDSGGNSGGTTGGIKPAKQAPVKNKSIGNHISNNRQPTKHFQSTSDVEVNSLITVGEDFSKFTRQSNRVSDNVNGNCLEGSSPFLQSEQAQQINESTRQGRTLKSNSNVQNRPDLFQPLAEALASGRSQGAVVANEDSYEGDDTLIPMKADVQDIIAQGGMLLSNEG